MADTRLEWRIDEIDGSPFKRFARNRHVEIWLVARERAVDPKLEAGRQIFDGEHGPRNAAFYVMPFQFDPAQIPQVETILGFVKAQIRTYGYPLMQEINALILLSSPTPERQVPQPHREPALVERLIADRHPSNTWHGRLWRRPKGDH